MPWQDILLIAFSCSLMSLVFVGVYVRFVVTPGMKKRIDAAREEIGQYVEDRIRERFVDEFVPMARDILRSGAKNAAMSGFDMAETFLSRISARRRERKMLSSETDAEE